MQQRNESTDGAIDTNRTNGADSTEDTSSTDGTSGVDPEARRRFLAGAKVAPPAKLERRPWDDLDPDEKADKGMNLRTNRYERSLLRHAAAAEEGGSMQKTIRALIKEGALARIERARVG